MKQNQHVIVAEKKFRLLQGEDDLTTYTFNTHAAKWFCLFYAFLESNNFLKIEWN